MSQMIIYAPIVKILLHASTESFLPEGAAWLPVCHTMTQRISDGMGGVWTLTIGEIDYVKKLDISSGAEPALPYFEFGR